MLLDIYSFLCYGVIFLFILFFLLCILLIKTTTPLPVIFRSKKEMSFYDPITNKYIEFPSLDDPWSIHLSVVVPAYEEQIRPMFTSNQLLELMAQIMGAFQERFNKAPPRKATLLDWGRRAFGFDSVKDRPQSGRKKTQEGTCVGFAASIEQSPIKSTRKRDAKLIPPMLDECLAYLKTRSASFQYEVIVVSDGSKDNTAKIAREYTKKHGADKVRVLELETNRGKGGAVRLVRRDYQTSPDIVAGSLGIVCGSRAHLEEQAISSRSFFRTFLMYGFHFLVWFFTVRGIRDTQCGFKLLTREAARICFRSLHVERWAFDVELLYIAQKLKIPISEVAVNWTEIEGSKLVPVWSWLQMGRDLFLIWLRYRIGAWKITQKSS
ncbi:Dolichyl-phosphate beta-glucosyltransferase [Blattella germanica]|nr:Dolichyl-phosphate beta-glucosyltransferase [Blattella germanica]